MSNAGALAEIMTLLSGITVPPFQMVLQGEPLSVAPGDRVVAFWYDHGALLFETLTDENRLRALTIRAYWRIQDSPSVRAAIEQEVMDAEDSIIAALAGHATLAASVTDLKINATSTGYVTIGGALYRALTVPVELWNYSGAAIAP